jgi:hypothetical protein
MKWFSVVALAAALSFSAPSFAAGGTLADVAASDPLPGPVPSQFGGCVGAKKNVCFAPSVSVSLVAYNFKSGKLEASFTPGLGYGFTVNPGNWSSVGLDAYLTMDSGAQRANVSLLGSFFNGYFRPGVSKAFIDDHSWRFLFASFGVPIQ